MLFDQQFVAVLNFESFMAIMSDYNNGLINVSTG